MNTKLSYNYFYNAVTDSDSIRESLEWANFWINTPKENERKFVLLGSSSMRLIRKALQKKIGGQVDLLATSAGFKDYYFSNQVDAFFLHNPACYECAFVQFGFHSLKNANKEWYNAEDLNEFSEGFSAFLDYLKQFCHSIVVVSAFTAVIPPKNVLDRWMNRLCLRKEHPNLEKNSIIYKKNLIAEEIANKHGVRFVNLTYFFDQHPKYRRSDETHYYGSGCAVVVDSLVKTYTELRQK